MKRTIHKTVTTETVTELRITAAEILDAFRLPEGTILTVATSRYQAGDDVELDNKEHVVVATHKTTEREEETE